MKFQKFYRIFSIALLLSLLMVVIPATPASAARVIEVDPEQGIVGDTITITGTGFTASTEATERHVDIYFAEDEAGTADDIGQEVNTYEYLKSPIVGYDGDDDEGEFETTFKVPERLRDGTDDEDVTIGPYYVYVTLWNTTRIKAVAEFTIIGGEITIDTEEGPVGTEVEIDGEDFGYKEDITIEYDDDEIDIKEGDEETDRDGEFNNTLIVIPESTAGEHTIRVIGDESGSEVEATFTVEPEIIISPDSGGIDTEVTVSGTGFGYKSDFGIFIDGTKVASDQTDKYGTFDVSFNMPQMMAGLYDIEAEDEDDNSDKAEFAFILASAALTPPTGHIGTEITASGTGFATGKIVTIKYDTTEIATPTVKTDGTFSTTFKVPASKHGDHKITITDEQTTKEFTFTMESKAPTVPAPLSPAMGVKVEQPVKLDWEDVTDDSPPVTYVLQIATSPDFTSLSMEIEKTELTKSEYTLSAVEKLEPVSEEEAFYWRVRAVDGAANESQWTGAGSFYIVAIEDEGEDKGIGIGGFKMPPWAIYVIAAFVALLTGILGFWMGRRTAYHY